MRLILCAVSAIALSGCSWLGGFQGKSKQGYHQKTAYGAYGQQQSYQYGQQAKTDPCQIFSPQQPIPRGCDPAQVTVGTAPQMGQYGATNGFPQQPQFGQPNYATNNYGSHANVAHQQGANHNRNVPQLRKPKFRGTLSLGAEKSFSGDVLDYATFPTDLATGLPTSPSLGYNPTDFDEGRITEDVDGGIITRTNTTFTAGNRDRFDALPSGALFDSAVEPSISLDDAWSTPTRIALGGEYILSKANTVFFNAGYSASEGKEGTVGSVNAHVYQVNTVERIDEATGVLISASPGGISFVPDEEIARFTADFSDMRRYDLEVGGRHYFNSWNKTSGLNTVTPFVGAAVGASHYNSVSYTTDQTQRFYEQAITDSDGEDTQFYNVDGNERQVDLYDSQWVPSGQLNVGAEWQVTPRTGIAVETGLRIEGARKYLNDEKGDTNIAIPFTIRGSYNF